MCYFSFNTEFHRLMIYSKCHCHSPMLTDACRGVWRGIYSSYLLFLQLGLTYLHICCMYTGIHTGTHKNSHKNSYSTLLQLACRTFISPQWQASFLSFLLAVWYSTEGDVLVNHDNFLTLHVNWRWHTGSVVCTVTSHQECFIWTQMEFSCFYHMDFTDRHAVWLTCFSVIN